MDLKPVMTLESAVISVNSVAKGESVGYGSQWSAERDSRIAVLAIGYGDGYPRHAPSGTPIWIRGKKVPLVGCVSMDMITVDVTDAPDVQIGDLAELWGEHIAIDTVANLCGTISYELFCQLTPRVPRVTQETTTTEA